MLDILRAIEYLTEDEQAQKKILICAVLTAIPLANVAAFGYEVEVTRRVARGEPGRCPSEMTWAVSLCRPAPHQLSRRSLNVYCHHRHPRAAHRR